jgi:hypothetical protein
MSIANSAGSLDPTSIGSFRCHLPLTETVDRQQSSIGDNSNRDWAFSGSARFNTGL